MKTSAVTAVLAAALAVCLTPVVSQAAIVFDTFPIDPNGQGAGDSAYYDGKNYDATACQFTVTGSDYWLDSVNVGLTTWSSGSVIVSLMADSANTPGAVLRTATLSVTGYNSLRTWETLTETGFRLNKDTSYWIALEPGSVGIDTVWNYSDASEGLVYWKSGASLPWFDSNLNAPYSPLCAFTVYGTPVAAEVVPEPSALILALLGGSGAMGGIMLRRKR